MNAMDQLKQCRPLTARQARVLELIQVMTTERGYPPTRRELRDRLGLKSTTSVQEYLKALQAKGRIQLDAKVGRGIRIMGLLYLEK
ncbi:SOS-response transcriptional repressor, LexA [Plesiocystis pacifica SIR-1]|uniref:SOS-response transcriptional repressor, LexA n=2 Tax=Plesiocystis pacifica TaxID=191768 RepID=A6GH58_9BACT|nr:SOS-response transcriptional repressor, LexA [Plesiocystis pacifica SIR-1]